MKTYSTPASAKAAVKKQGLYLMDYEILEAEGRFYPHFICEISTDVHELYSRGFSAELGKTKNSSLSFRRASPDLCKLRRARNL